jgi:calcineurin-like phosphoesterase family protein
VSARDGDFWFTGDWHLGHQRICELSNRPFASVDEMNEQLIERHNALVKSNDRVWILGDVCMGQIDDTLALVSRFNGVKYLVAGNHDRCFHGYGDNQVNKPQFDHWVARYRAAGFAMVVTGAHTRRNGFGPLVEVQPLSYGPNGRQAGSNVNVELCHFPTTGESRPGVDDRFAEYRPRPLGGVDRRPTTKRWVLCGHVHDRWLSSGRNLNVGVDRWNFAPVHMDEVARYVTDAEERLGTALDDVGRSTEPGPARPPSVTHTLGEVRENATPTQHG